jgi:UDPglucose 6-dehydrogenase
MKIAVIGTGYVGLPAGAGFAKQGHDVTCVDIDEEKVEKINRGECPIYEEGLPELLEKVVGNGKLEASTDTTTAVKNADIVMLAVGTPMDEEENINLDYIEQASRDVVEGMKKRDGYQTIVVKSTVVPGTTEGLIEIFEESGKKAGEDFGVCMNPEFLREGTALDDFLNPDRIVIGELDEKSGDQLGKIYSKFDAPVMRTSLEAAELIKYASNSLLATKISFINEIGNLCKKLDVDVYEVADGVGMDSRLKRDFLNSGPGWGGSCFPKDVRALIKFMEDKEVDSGVLKSAVEQNKKQKTRLVEILEDKINIEGKTIAVLGLAFKPGTDDIRNSPAIDIMSELKEKRAEVKAYDPEAMENMREKHPDIEYAESAASALQEADAGLIVTHWEEFNDLTMEEIRMMNNPIIIEGRKMEYEILEEHTEGITWP